MKLLNVDSNAKTVKGQAYGFLTGILYLAPASLSGRNVCPQATDACKASCLNLAGMGKFDSVQKSRIAKTKWFYDDRQTFFDQLCDEVEALVRKSKRMNLTPVVRLNGTSDLPWEAYNIGQNRNIFDIFPAIQAYDYTKVTKRALNFAKGNFQSNYHLTFSRSGENDDDVDAVRLGGGNVAAVYSPEAKDDLLADKPNNVDGDLHDLRFLDPKGSWVLLKAKGPAIHDQSNFVIR